MRATREEEKSEHCPSFVDRSAPGVDLLAATSLVVEDWAEKANVSIDVVGPVGFVEKTAESVSASPNEAKSGDQLALVGGETD